MQIWFFRISESYHFLGIYGRKNETLAVLLWSILKSTVIVGQ